MAYPKVHANAEARNKAAMAAFRARQRAKTPLERFVGKKKLTFTYTPAEAREVAAIRNLLSELETRAERLNGTLKERLKGEPNLQAAAAELEVGFTKIQLPVY